MDTHISSLCNLPILCICEGKWAKGVIKILRNILAVILTTKKKYIGHWAFVLYSFHITPRLFSRVSL